MYKKYYKLNKNPFQITPDQEVFFASKGHKKALSYLQYGLSQGEGFIVITGDIGTGKTTIVKNLIAGLDAKTHIAKQIVTTNLEEQDLMEMVCETFDLMSKGLTKAALLNQFQAFLISAHKLGRRVVLIVDEVQNLPAKTVEELRMLSNFQVENRPLMQSFLVGQKEFVATLQGEDMEQLRQRVIASCHLSPLKREETKDYINYRLDSSGWTGGDLFDAQAFELIYGLTDGVPRRINVFCDRILLFGFLEEISFFAAKHIKLVANELADEITSPIKMRKPEELSSYFSEIQKKYDNKLKKSLIVKVNNSDDNSKKKLEPKVKKIRTERIEKKETQRTKNNKVVKQKQIVKPRPRQIKTSDSEGFVDIEETIKDFESRVEKEIQEYKSTLKVNLQ